MRRPVWRAYPAARAVNSIQLGPANTLNGEQQPVVQNATAPGEAAAEEARERPIPA
jgi:hypothetical protein